MKRLSRALVTMCVAIVIMVGLSVPVMAVGTDVDKKSTVVALIKSSCTVDSSGNIKYSNGTVKAYVKEKPDETYNQAVVLSDGATTVYFNTASMDLLYKQAEKAESNAKVDEKVSEMTGGLTVEANTGAASIMLSGFKPIVELTIGILVVLIALGMTIFSAIDIAYIAFPVFRNKCEEAKESGNGAMTKKSASGDVSLRWVSDDAQYAITQGTIDSGKSKWKLYFGKRVGSYIMLGIIQFILLTGNITLITDIALNIVSGIIDVLSSMAS